MSSKKSQNERQVDAIVSQQSNEDGKLSPEQIQNWRRVLSMMVGPYAFLMPDSEVHRHRDEMQKRADKLSA